MYIKIIILSLLISLSESAISGLCYPNTPLRRVMPIMMEANANFAGAIQQDLYNMWLNAPLDIQNDTFMTAGVQEDDVSMNVTDLQFIDMRDCRIVKTDAALLTLTTAATIYCKAITLEGNYEVPGETDQTIRVKLTKVKINMNFDLKLDGHILVVERASVKFTFEKGFVKAPCVKTDMNDAVFSSLFKDVIEKKIIFYFKTTVGDMLQEALGSISITESLQNDYYAISSLKAANRALSKMVNSVVDQQQEKFLKSKCKNGYFPVKNMNLTFAERFMLLTYRGRIRLTDGYIGNVKTFKKIGSLALFGSASDTRFVILVKVHVGKALCNFEHMHTTIWGLRFIYLGGVKASVNSITAEIAIDLSLDVLGFVAEVNEVVLYIPRMGRIKSQIQSLGALLGLIASFMQSLVTELFHYIFVWVFERKIEAMLNDILVGQKIELMG